MSGDRTAERLADALPGILRNPVGKASRPLSEVIAALWPVVDAIADERARQAAAAELEAAAAYWDRPGVRTVASDLRDRAAALRGTP